MQSIYLCHDGDEFDVIIEEGSTSLDASVAIVNQMMQLIQTAKISWTIYNTAVS